MTKQQLFTGAGVAIVTPMLDNGRVNYDVLSELIEYQIAGGSDAIITCGTTGEASTLDDDEHLAVIEHCVKTVAGRLPVIAGTGSNDTRHVVELSREAEARGVDGLLQVTPYYNKTNQSGLIQHFLAVADAVDVPLILYNVPSRTGMTIKPDTYKELAKHPRIVATKEASGDISHIAKVAAMCEGQLAIYSGNDDQTLPILALGGIGIISVVSNVAPQKMHDLCAAWFAGDTSTALRIQLDILALNDALFCDVNPIPVKAAVQMIGFAAGRCRLPLGALSQQNLSLLRQRLQSMGLAE